MLKHIISAFLILCATVAQAQTTYTKVTSGDEIVAGGVYVIAVNPSGATPHYANGFTQTTGFTSSESQTNFTGQDSFTCSDAMEITLEEVSGKTCFYINVMDKGYLYSTSGETYLNTSESIQGKGNITWNVTIGTNAIAKIQVVNHSSRQIKFYNFNYNYRDSGGSDIILYKKVTTTPPASGETVSINECGYATLCSDVALDFTDSGVEAYTGSISGDKLLLTKVDKVPAGAGVILYKENGGSATISAADGEVTVLENNVLRGTTEAKTVRAGEKIYVLQNVDGEAAFCQVKQDTTLAKGKAYLDLSDSPVSAAKLTVAFSTPTSITAIQSTPNHTAHTLSGQRVSTAFRGIVVRDGKKIIQR